ncbi:MAG: HD domain-containing phosphohydrolase [Thermacetogeniaceae bacterium]
MGLLKKAAATIALLLSLLLSNPSPSHGYTATGDNNYPPHVYLNSEGKPEGFDIEVLKLIGEKENVDFQITLLDWEKAKKGVVSGKYDILIGAVPTPERERYLDFSKPYMQSKYVLFVPAEQYHIHSLKDLENRRLGVQKDSYAEDYLKNYPGLNLYVYNSQPEALRALAEGRVDAVAANYYTGIYAIEKEGLEKKIKAIGDPFLIINYTFAVKEGNTHLLSIINRGIDKIQASGELEELRDRWFGRRIILSSIISYLYSALAGIAGITIFSLVLYIYLRQRIKRATKDLVNANRKIHEAYEGTIRAIVKALEKKESRTAIHSLRTNKIANAIGKALGLSREELKTLNWSTLLHDIGKLGVSEQILLKPGPLTAEEYEAVKKHCIYGYEILRDIDYLNQAAEVALYHHERYDGNGYPFGIRDEEIPLLARICTLADAFEAMTADRPYRKAMTLEEAIEEIKRNSGTQFDPKIVEAFLKLDPKGLLN